MNSPTLYGQIQSFSCDSFYMMLGNECTCDNIQSLMFVCGHWMVTFFIKWSRSLCTMPYMSVPCFWQWHALFLQATNCTYLFSALIKSVDNAKALVTEKFYLIKSIQASWCFNMPSFVYNASMVHCLWCNWVLLSAMVWILLGCNSYLIQPV